MTTLKNGKWKALEMPDTLGGGKYHLQVDGEVETTASNMIGKLHDRKPQGTNPRILLLDLTIESTGKMGQQTVALRPIEQYRKPTNGRAYDLVEIFYKDKQLARIEVEHPKT
jgi:hypothetical protein